MKEIIGRNIKKYRKAAGHTQQDLGDKIGYSDKAISAFETGVNTPDTETLAKIAAIYGITIEDLLADTGEADFTISNLSITEDKIGEMVDAIYPMFYNEKVMENKEFKEVYYKHKKIQETLKTGSGVSEDTLFNCISDYAEIWNNHQIYEAVANMLSLLFIRCAHIVDFDALKLQEKLFDFHKIENRQAKPIFDRDEEKIQKIKERKEEFSKNHYETKIQALRILSEKPEWNDLVNYYVAHSYILNFTQNDNTIPQNIRSGRLLMEDFAELGNPYCTAFLKCAYAMYK